MKKAEILALSLILFFGFLVRLYRFDNPIADWHSWRQADTSSVSRNFVNNGFDFLYPKYDDISKIPSGLDNPEGYRFVEFPIFNFFQAGLFKSFGIFTLEQWGRLASIFSSLTSALFIFLLIKKYLNKQVAFFSTLFFLFLPFSVYYSRTILPDEMMIMASLGSIYFFDRWIHHKKFSIFNFQFSIILLFTASSFLLKPYALFFTLPMFILAYNKFGLSFLKKWQLWLFLILSVAPLFAWRMWMQQYPEGIPASDWLFNAGNIRFKGAFFYWIFAERISKLILGYFGLVLLILGLLKQEKDENYLFFLSFLASALFYIFVIARGNVQHDYYQILIIPAIAIFLGRGISSFLSICKVNNKLTAPIILVIIIIFMFSFSWYYIKDYFNVNNWSIVKAGEEVDRVIPLNAKVIAPYNGDTSFLYQTNRRGWPVFDKSIEDFIQQGAEYLIIANPTTSDFEGFGRQFKTISSSSSYLILKLK